MHFATLQQLADLLNVHKYSLVPYIQDGTLKAKYDLAYPEYELTDGEIMTLALDLTIAKMSRRITRDIKPVPSTIQLLCSECGDYIESVSEETNLWAPICEFCSMDTYNLMMYRRESL